jgi:hypothetical protein
MVFIVFCNCLFYCSYIIVFTQQYKNNILNSDKIVIKSFLAFQMVQLISTIRGGYTPRATRAMALGMAQKTLHVVSSVFLTQL